MNRPFLLAFLAAAAAILSIERATADSFGGGVNSFSIEFVTIGDPGNPPDAFPNPAGAVPYTYRIGKYEIPERAIDAANALGGLGITKDTRGPDYPATSISWFEAARFVNWLNTSKGHSPAYKFDMQGTFELWAPTDAGYDATNLYRNKLAHYFLPSLDEWHKAAYYDPLAGVYYDYPTGSDSIPDGIDFVGDPVFDAVFFDGAANPGPNDIYNVGLMSESGTYGQGGNVEEWEESAFDRINDSVTEERRAPGGTWGGVYTRMAAPNTLIGILPSLETDFIGLRVSAKVPEPVSAWNLSVFVLVALAARRISSFEFRASAGLSKPSRWRHSVETHVS